MQFQKKYRYALVELYSELPQNAYEDVGDATQEAILAESQSRSLTVSQVLDELDNVSVERVLFPGWTLVGFTPPSWFLDRSVGRTIVVEMLPPLDGAKQMNPLNDHRWRAFVVCNREFLVGPVFQLFYSGTQVGEVGSPSKAVVDLATQLSGQTEPNRRWNDSNWPDAGLIMCEEVNVIYSPNTPGPGIPVIQNFPSLDLIMNPAHKPNWLDAMRRKRRHLSQMKKNAALLMTANTHGPWVKVEASPQNPRWTAAEAYCNGYKVTPNRVIEVDNHRLLLFE